MASSGAGVRTGRGHDTFQGKGHHADADCDTPPNRTQGTFGCGAVITDAAGSVVAEGRNRVFGEPSGEYLLEGTRLAHAEMNALARVPAGVALDDCTLWSSLEPCLVCLSSALLSNVGEIRFLAPDPLWDGVERLPSLNAFVERRWPFHHEPHDSEWAVLGRALALHMHASGER